MSKQNVYDNQVFFEGYCQTRAKAVNYNDLLEKPAVIKLLSSKHYDRVLDLGCGFGTYSGYLADRGSKVTAVDISRKMIDKARLENYHHNIEYRQATMEDFNYPSNTYNLVLSTLALHYIQELDPVIHNIANSLTNDGDFIFTVEHPSARAAKDMGWERDERGEKRHWRLANYFERGERQEHWIVDAVIKYHRTISDYFYLLKNNDFIVRDLIEIEPDADTAKLLPEAVQRPSFLLIKAVKL